MRADLLDAQATIDWAVAQIPVMEERLATYYRRRPYVIEMEPDPDGSGHVLLVVYVPQPPDPLINAEVGAIINSLRSGLDLMHLAVLGRHGVKFNRDAHFPIRTKAADFRGEVKALKTKQWLSQGEFAAIKKLRPYKRGNRPLWLLNQLDILRKHRRLIEVRPKPIVLRMPMYLAGTQRVGRHLKGKSVLLRYLPGTDFLPTEDNCEVTLEVTLHEPRLGLMHQPVKAWLCHFADAVGEAIKAFDAP